MTRVYNPNDGLTSRKFGEGGLRLDELELVKAEEARAKVENRKPDFSNLQGPQLVTALQLAGGDPRVAEMIEQNADNPDLGPNPVGKLEVAKTSAKKPA